MHGWPFRRDNPARKLETAMPNEDHERVEALARRSRSRTLNQAGLEYLAAGFGALRHDPLQQETGGKDAHLVARLVYAGQRYVAELGKIGVVVADEGEVARDGETRLVGRG